MSIGLLSSSTPILSTSNSLFVLWNVGRNLKKVMTAFLQTAPEAFDVGDSGSASGRW
ncbi:hypothetical protein Hsar01_03166 [Haloferula sargassicola]|uniref:Uncharacterized protein n=1 Tax=Haloferula sargassicola TaxID=490096 RepID=A0ABP9UV52_9BACT